MAPPDTYLSIVIPAFNEAGRLPHALARIDDYLCSRDELCPVEVLVVDDGSTDGTATLAEGFAAAPTLGIRTLVHPRNRGKGAAVRTGLRASTGQYVLLCDADLATPITELPRVMQDADEQSILIGSRALDRTRILVKQPLLRDLMGRVFNLLAQALVLPGIWDSQCGFKLFPGSVARRLAESQRIDGFAFDVELLARARAAGLSVREIPVQWRHVESSRVLPGRHSMQMLRDLCRIAFWMRVSPGERR